MITSAITVLRPTAPGVAPGTALPAGATGPSAYQVAVAAGYTGTVAQWLASLAAPSVSAAQLAAAVQALLGAPSGIAPLDKSTRLPVANLPILAFQVIRAARPVLVAAGGSMSAFLADAAGGADAGDGSFEAVQAGVPAPPAGILAGLLTTYLVTALGQSSTQAAATIAAIWSAATGISP